MLLKILLNALAFSLISNGQDVRTGHKLVSHQDILITMKKNISEEEWETHRNLLLKTVNGELGYTVEEIGRNLGVSQDIIESIPLTEEEVETSMKAVKGYLETFGFGTFKGYSGQFPQWFIELVKKIPLVDIVEEESELSVLQASNGFVKEGLITSELSPNIQIQPDWGLVRISHRQNVYDGIYTYPQNPGQNVDIYVIDSGVLKEHQEFKNRIVQSPNFSSDVDNFDYPSHGTHVAAIAAGEIYGVAKYANIVSVKVLNKSKKCSIAALVNALAWVTQNVGLTGRRSVVNLSLGGSQTSDTIKRAIEELHRLNIPISVAAGNVKSDACLSSPQDSELVFTVGASDQQDYVAEFSSFGKCVDIFAPGANITSASSSDVNHNVLLSGTSQAAPFVAGQMAILMSLYPDISVDELYDILRKTATVGVIKGLRTDDPDLLLFNGIKTVSLGGGNSQWRLIIQTLLSGFL